MKADDYHPGIDPRDLHAAGIRYVGDAQRITLGPNDVLVIRIRGPVSMAMREHLQGMASEGLKLARARVLVLEAGTELGVLEIQPPTG